MNFIPSLISLLAQTQSELAQAQGSGAPPVNVAQVVITLVTGVILGSIGAGVAAIAVRKRTKAETVDLITESAERIILRLEAIISRLESENGEFEREVQALKNEVRRMRDIIRSLGHDPDDPKFRAQAQRHVNPLLDEDTDPTHG